MAIAAAALVSGLVAIGANALLVGPDAHLCSEGLASFRFDAAMFDPPRNCGRPAPSEVPEPPVPCSLVGETPDHVTVYAAGATTHDPTYNARVGRSVVTLKDANTLKPIPQDLAMHVFGSLEKASATRLRELNNQLG